MISDRISLNLAYIYLRQFENTIGKITDIEMNKIPMVGNTNKGLTRFSDLPSVLTFIQNNAPLVPFDKLDCGPLSLYEIKAINVVIDNANKNLVTSDNRVFKTMSANVNQAGLDILNTQYIPEYLKVLNTFNEIKTNEYIELQFDYIDCGYINTFFEEDYIKVQELYKKYKNR